MQSDEKRREPDKTTYKSVGNFPFYSFLGGGEGSSFLARHTTSLFYAVCMKHSFTVETKEIQETRENIVKQKRSFLFLMSVFENCTNKKNCNTIDGDINVLKCYYAYSL